MDGGAIYAYHNFLSKSDVYINAANVAFNNNTAINNGGAISATNVYINAANVAFNNNTATEYGGAIEANNGVLSINATNVAFNNNTASWGGGAICAYNDVSINAANVAFNNNTASIYAGGAICVYWGFVSINATNVTFNNNTATFNNGGAIYAGADVSINAANVTFKYNDATNGGAIYLVGKIILNNALFINNDAELGSTIYTKDIELNNTKIESTSQNSPLYITGIGSFKNNTYIIPNNIAPISFKGTNITSHVTAIVNNNNTEHIKIGHKTQINVTFFDDNNNIIAILNNNLANVTLNNINKGYLVNKGLKSFINYTVDTNGVFLVNVSSAGLSNLTVKTATIIVDKIEDYNITVSGELNVGSAGGVITVNFPEDATGNVTLKINDQTIEKTIETGKIITNITKLNAGDNNITVIYSGDSKYNGTNRNLTFNVPKVTEYNITVSAKLNNDTSGGVVVIELPSDATGNVTVIVNEESFNEELIGGKVIIDVTDIKVGSNFVSVNYSGDSKYNSSRRDCSIVLPMVEDYNITVSGELNVGSEGGVITVDFPEDATGNVTLIINGEIIEETIGAGIVITNITNLNVGDNNITVVYSGDGKYNGTNRNLTFNVPKIEEYDITVSGNITGDEGIVKVVVPGDANGNITVTINGKNYTAGIIDGVAIVKILKLTPGTYNVTTTYLGDSKYDLKVLTQEIIFESDFQLVVDDLVMYYHDGSKLVASLVDSTGKGIANKTITFQINGKEYSRITDENGNTSLGINLNYGIYPVTVLYNDLVKNVNVTVYSTVFGEDIVKLYHNGTQYYAFFCNSKGEVLVNTDVQFNINGVMYTRTTNASGVAKLNINLNPGKYILTAINPFNGEMWSNNVTVVSTIESEDVTKMYHNDTKYSAQFFNTDGSVLVNKEVIFNINGVFYTKTTDSEGYATLAINLLPGNYIITAYNPVTGEAKSNNIVVKPILVGKDLTKVYGENATYDVLAYDSQGNLLAGANVTININGVFYYKITDDDGVAHLDINLNPGEYVATAYYNGFATSNKIIVLDA